jgi:vanillate O-demethylase ferredoxin subunit
MPEEGFTVKLARSDREIFVRKGGSILFRLLEEGINVPFSCGAGHCGTCETEVISGTPEHRDFVLTDEERTSGKLIMICCSGSKTPELELNL